MSIQIHLDAFIACNSLTNARKLVAHVNKHPMVLCMISEDHAGQVRNAERMVASVTPLAAATTCKLAEAADKLS